MCTIHRCIQHKALLKNREIRIFCFFLACLVLLCLCVGRRCFFFFGSYHSYVLLRRIYSGGVEAIRRRRCGMVHNTTPTVIRCSTVANTMAQYVLLHYIAYKALFPICRLIIYSSVSGESKEQNVVCQMQAPPSYSHII